MTTITRPFGSLCTHGSDLPECQSAWASVHYLFGDYVRIMQETTVMAQLCKPRATWNEVGLYLCWKWVMCLCLYVSVCVCMCQYVLSSLCLLVASVLPSIRWLLCGRDGSKKNKTKSVITKKNARNFSPLRFKLIQKIRPSSNHEYYGSFNSKKLNLQRAFL